MAGNTTKLMFELFGRDNASPVFDKFGRRVRSAGDDIGFMTKATKGLIGAAAGYVTFREAADFLKGANDEAREAQKVNALTANALKTTGAEAWTSSSAIADYSAKLSVKNAIDDETIQSSANLLLTFKNVRNEVGKGSDIFNRATAASVDLSASGFGSIDGAAKMLGKSLNDPLKGITALGRAGVTFSEGQKAQIKQLVQQNDLLGAQKIILGEVESQVKGSAAAQATSMEKLDVVMGNAQETIGTALLPLVDDLAEGLADNLGPAAQHVSDWLTGSGVPAMHDFYDSAKPVAADVLPAIADAGEQVVDVLKFLGPLAGDVASGFGSLPGAGQQAILLGAGVALLGNKVKNVVPDFTNLEGGLDRGKTKAAAMRGGIGLLGVGMSAFSEQLGGTHQEITDTVNILGNAAVGFAAGGPWGAAVGAGVGIVQAFGAANHHAVADVDALTSSLDAQTGKLSTNTTELVKNALEKDGAYKKARQLGVNLGDVTDAATGDKGALGRINAQRDATAAESARLAEHQSPGSGPAQAAGVKKQFDELTDSIGAQSGAVAEARQKWDNLNDAQRDSKSLNKLSADQIRDVTKATQGIPKRAVTQFTQPGYSGAVKNAVDIARKYKLTPKQVTTALKALDYSSADIRKVLRLMKEADAARANPKIDADTGNSVSKINLLQRTIDGMHGKTVRVAVKGGTGGGITMDADGSIHTPGGRITSFFAEGGTHDLPNQHIAEIAPAGNKRIWNEPETGGEAYIPLAPSKRARSRQIAMETVDQLGGVAFFANGGTTKKKTKKKAKSSSGSQKIIVPDVQKPEDITAEWLAAHDMDPTISAYDAINQPKWSDWAAQAVAAAARPEAPAKPAGGSSSAKSSSGYVTGGMARSRASQRSAAKRAKAQYLEGAIVQVQDSSGRSMRGTIRTRG